MRYIDTGSRDPAHSLGGWLQSILTNEVEEVRWQSGFFSADGLGFFAPVLERLRDEERTVVAVVGSNDGETLRGDVERLVALLGVPRPNAHLGIVSFSGSFFHPKTYHLRRSDGTQAAYVGSANLTTAGMVRHVEAGVVLDTREGDAVSVLDDIAAATDAWRAPNTSGYTAVEGQASIDSLVANGVLSEARPPRPATASGGSAGTTQPRLRPVLTVPSWTPAAPGTGAVVVLPPPPGTPSAVPGGSTVLLPGFPNYLLFEPGAAAPTTDSGALTGAYLPFGAVGLVVRLNKDSARHFSGGVGTANISLPVDTLSTLRFGIHKKKFDRPRAEYELNVRYVGSKTFRLVSIKTNVMPYGFVPGEAGHGDVRMLVPAAVRELGTDATRAGLPAPTDGDFALLEWPTAATPAFHLTFLERGSLLFQQAQKLFNSAAATNQLVGDGACWLPPNVAPPW